MKKGRVPLFNFRSSSIIVGGKRDCNLQSIEHIFLCALQQQGRHCSFCCFFTADSQKKKRKLKAVSGTIHPSAK